MTLRPTRPARADLRRLATAVGLAYAGPDVPIDGVTLDSRQVCPGDLYVGLAGARAHGAAFVADAVARGAVALLTDDAGAALAAERAPGLPVLLAAEPRVAMAALAAELYGRPAARLTMFAVTGTNGKTTTAYLVEAALAAAGVPAGLIGTIGYRVLGEPLTGSRTTVTTPESVDLHALLALMSERGARAVAMEVSSHAMVLRRTEPVVFDVAAFTNLGRDHLDFHPTMEDYFEAKASLFTPAHARHAVVNVDDPWGRRLAERVRAAGELPLLTTGSAADADVRLLQIRGRDDHRQGLLVAIPGGEEVDVELGLPGHYNAANAVTALAMIAAAGLDVRAAAAGLADASVPGRMQRVELPGQAPTVFVDFAHTPQAIESVLAAIGETNAGRTIVVLGAGGDRDAAKRPAMGAAAARGAQVVIVTDDNPRSEDPAAIRAAVLAGAADAAREDGNAVAETLVDGGARAAAIARALALAGPADTVAVLGKGHEQGQDVGGVVTPFDDAAVVAAAWEELRR